MCPFRRYPLLCEYLQLVAVSWYSPMVADGLGVRLLRLLSVRVKKIWWEVSAFASVVDNFVTHLLPLERLGDTQFLNLHCAVVA